MSHRKIYVLDTSVLVHNPNSFKDFTGNEVLIPITVLDELDKIKSYSSEAGKNARVAIRKLDTVSDQLEVHAGIEIENDILLRIDTSAYGALGIDPSYGDNRILACAYKVMQEHPNRQVILVSKDINLRIRARAFGLSAEDYEKDKTSSTDLYEGFRVVEDADAGEALAEATVIMASSYDLDDFYPNECVVFVDENGKGLATGRKIGDQIRLVKETFPWNLKLRNKEQLFAADLMMDPNVSLVSVVGTAGSGKTLIAIASALEMVINKRIYDRIILYRPMTPVGSDIGFLPGTIDEKVSPWFGPIDDAFAFLCSDRTRKKDGWKQQLFQYTSNGTISKEALTFIRGRSLNHSLVIVDESQNLSKEEAKTIITRIGVDSKIVLNGDLTQIDNTYLDATNNGLSYIVEAFKSNELAGHITFKKGERSELATVASEIL